jgi:Ser/Thr protein kinase RdoA (MazF antagonist)
VRWWLDRNQPARAVDEARHLLTGYDSVSRLTRRENEDLPALALAAALGLIDFFLTEHDLVEESWLRTAHWIDDNFGALRLPASALGGRTSGRDR